MQRRNDIDWLRIFATYLLFIFHGAMIFSPAPFYHVRNAQVSTFMLVLAGFISLWHMPLFFLLAGWSAYGSLSSRGPRHFLRERLLKLGVPLVAGCITIGPILKYFELRSGLDLSHTGLRVAPHLQESFRSVVPAGLPTAPSFHETFLEFLPSFFTSLDRFTWGHLWFVAYLLTFSLLYLPLFSRMARRPQAEAATSNSRPWSSAWVYMPSIPLAAIQVLLRPYWPGVQNLYDDWANFAYYSTFLIMGFVLARAPGFEAALHREAKRALGVSLLAMLVLLGAVLRLYESQTLLLAGSAIAGWSFIVALLGFAHRYLAQETRGVGYLRESAFPVYILHQPALVTIGYVIVATSFGIAAKYLAIVTLALGATLGFYHFAVQRSRFLRFIYGMKPPATCPVRPVARATVSVMLLMAMAIRATATNAASAAPLGLWWAEGGAAQVEIRHCMDDLCGRVTWLRSPLDDDGCALRDEHNPDPANRTRPVLGLEIMQGLRRADGISEWVGGTIYDPATGNTYRCRLSLEDDDTLLLRGYVGIPLIGRTTKWFRVDSTSQRCGR